MANARTSDDGDIHDLDILIIGAGISGISAAYYVQTNFPGKSYQILEGRENLGGTWDLFKFPGIRSDSWMPSFSFSFRPWQSTDLLARGDVILNYLKDTVKEFDIEKQIEFRTLVQTADWDSKLAKWTLQTSRGDDNKVIYRAPYLFLCTGYYNYEHGHCPSFPNQEAFKGPIIHPQFWPDDLNHSDKKIVVIGSGATAVTLVPALAKRAKHVTMVQRSPTYMGPGRPKASKFAQFLLHYFGAFAYRWFYILKSLYGFWLCRTFPGYVKGEFLKEARTRVGEERFNPRHYTPRYNPWDQRLCLCPDGDFYAAIRSGSVDIVTDHIQEFTANGLRLKDSKEELKADIIVTATGLDLQFGGDIQFSKDGSPCSLPSKFSYKGFMLESVPNLFFCMGYTNNSWTLKVDLTNQAACRLIKATEHRGSKYCQPEISTKQGRMPALPWLDLQSGYVQRNTDKMPKRSDRMPWKHNENYLQDKFLFERLPLEEDDSMKFLIRPWYK